MAYVKCPAKRGDLRKGDIIEVDDAKADDLIENYGWKAVREPKEPAATDMQTLSDVPLPDAALPDMTIMTDEAVITDEASDGSLYDYSPTDEDELEIVAEPEELEEPEQSQLVDQQQPSSQQEEDLPDV